MNRLRLSALGVTVMLTGMIRWGTAPVSAASPFMDGAGTWEGIVSFGFYPCDGGCPFTFTGTFAGAIAVFDSSHVPLWQATWPSGSPMTGQLQVSGTYSESCGFLPFVSPLDGTATGTFTISGGTLTQDGKAAGTAVLTGGWAESRVGPVMQLSSTTPLTLEDGAGTVLAVAQTAAVGAGVMGPPVEPVSAMPLPPNCANEQPVSAFVGGEMTQADG